MVEKSMLALSSIYIIWGSTFLAVRYVLESFPPLAMSGARFGVADHALSVPVRGRCPPGQAEDSGARLPWWAF